MCQNLPELTEKIEWVFNNVDLLAFISRGMEQLFEEHTKLLGMNIHSNNRQVLEIGADSDLFRKKWKKRKNSKNLLMMVGRMDYPKRQDLIIEALRILNNKKIELHFFGDGPAKSGLSKLAKEYGLKDQVIFHGFVSQDTIAAFLEHADIFCHASEYEGLCKSIVEALSTGTPALVSDVVSINTYIIDGVNGYLVKNDSGSWAERINDILSKEDGLNSISENEILFANNNYNPDKKIEEYIEAFSALIGRTDIN
jgi:colanic acid/amylovoran biosynthesis glycosyltransferase